MEILDMEFLTRTITECTRMGLPKMVRDAEEEGFLIVTRDKNPVAVILPLTIDGLKKMVRKVTYGINATDESILTVSSKNFEVIQAFKNAIKLYNELKNIKTT